MTACRAQGRPRRGDDEVGREKIVGKLRSVLRSGTITDLSRKALSEQAGVTPALISYYFPKKEDLLREIAGPVLLKYRLEIETALAVGASKDDQLQKVVGALVRLYKDDGGILDIYEQLPSGYACELIKINVILSSFFANWGSGASEEQLDATVLQGAVWGMCRFAIRVGSLRQESSSIEYGFPCLVTKMVNAMSLELSMHLGNIRKDFVEPVALPS